MEFQNLLLAVEDSIALLTINRPRAMNALNSETLRELGLATEQLNSDPLVQGLIIIGSGDKAFVAGADIAELNTKNPISGREFALTGQLIFNRIEALPKPVIAAVNGFALGGGCELAMACHLRVASAQARFGQPEVGLGLIPGFGGTQRLPRLIGKGRALELLLGGGLIDAAEAYRIGLVNCVVEAWKTDADGVDLTDEKGRKIFDREEFVAAVIKMMKGFLEKGPAALAYVLEAVNRGLDVPLTEGLRIEADLFGNLYATHDSHEGLTAFLEKRKANFTGK
ncbi:MAG: enoyl-CoA hydratase-related protein [Calditrichota bacterium]